MIGRLLRRLLAKLVTVEFERTEVMLYPKITIRFSGIVVATMFWNPMGNFWVDTTDITKQATRVKGGTL